MISRGPRWASLLLVFVVQLALGILIYPVILAPALLEERFPAPEEVVRGYAHYLWSAVNLGWVETRNGSWVFVVAILAWTGLAVAFISPIVGPARREPSGRALWPSVIAAAVLGACIAALLFAAIVEGAVAWVAADKPAFTAWNDQHAPWIWLSALGVWCTSGAVWVFLLRGVGRSRDPNGLDRLVRMVFAGTAVELVLGLPIYLMVRKKYSCYCGMATFLNLVMGVAALCWLCGPCAVLLATREARRNWRLGACPRCGYLLRSGSTVCSECGT